MYWSCADSRALALAESVSYFFGFLRRLRREERGVVAALAVHERDEARGRRAPSRGDR